MKLLIAILLCFTFGPPVLAESRSKLTFEIQLMKEDDLISAPRWVTVPGSKAHISVGQEYKPTDSITMNLGVEAGSICSLNGDQVTYAVVLCVRKLKEDKGDPETQLIATFDPEEYFLTGKMEVGSSTTFTLENNKTIRLIISRVVSESYPNQT
ncbi:hypothetical protein [Puniceicoccus vermicola]|uniref:Uncharacterized protein n=1 Tax=Puniceicoccus vermicola TaxID=388746 RepID=A0A7X1AXT0_9BACT|nr:hypothetical protein [Puniceicoccus vermicola]MBC2600780.1 hypothetical protein [Puniceicoccus vermicola]